MYDLRNIMLRAWGLYRKGNNLTFAECLHRAWLTAKAEPVNAERIADAKAAAGITEDTNTWSGWRKAGYEVIHGSKTLFGCDLIYGSKVFFSKSWSSQRSATSSPLLSPVVNSR